MRLCAWKNFKFGRELNRLMKSAIVLALAILISAGCGYRLVGADRAPRAGTLYIMPPIDNSREPLFGAALGKALSREAVDRAGMTLSTQLNAQYLLLVEAGELTQAGAAYSTPDVVREYLLTARATATLKNREDEIVWKDTSVKASREYSTALSASLTEEAKNQAISLLAADLSREIVRRISLATWMKSQ